MSRGGIFTSTGSHFNPPQKIMPKKQGRMFHIELGQNDGPFKETAKHLPNQAIMGSGGVPGASMTSTSKYSTYPHGSNSMNHTMKSSAVPDMIAINLDERPTQGESIDSIKNLVERIEEIYASSVINLDVFKNSRDNLMSENEELFQKVISEHEDVLGDLAPVMKKDYKLMKRDIKAQKDENELLLKNLTDLRKEAGELAQQIGSCKLKIARLEDTLVGEIKHPALYIQ